MVLFLWVSRHASHLLVWHITVERIMWVCVGFNKRLRTCKDFFEERWCFPCEYQEFPVANARECFVSQWKSLYRSLTLLTLILAIRLVTRPPESPTDAAVLRNAGVVFVHVLWCVGVGVDCCARFFAARCYLNSTGLWQRPCSLYVDTRTYSSTGS
jgi:hypothetical protein